MESHPGFEEMHEYPTSRDNTLSKFRSIMAAACLRFGMVFYGVVLVMLVLCNTDTVTGQNTTGTTPTTPTTPTTNATTVPPTTKKNPSTTVSTTKPTTTVRPTTSNRSTAVPTSNGTKSTPMSNGTSTAATPTTHGNPNTTVSSTNMMSPTPTPKGHGADRGKWVATGFAVFFLVTTIVMTVLYCRQRKIYRELEGDSSLSRLI